MPNNHPKRLVRLQLPEASVSLYFRARRGILVMSAPGSPAPALVSALLLAAVLAGCQAGPTAGDEPAPETVVDDANQGEVEPEIREFSLPTLCQDILPDAVIDELTSGEISLLRGPGSGSTDSVYPEGPSPQEERGGLSCLFGNPDETATFTLSIAPMTQLSRAEVIDGLLAQQLNPGQTADGVLTYWIQGDEATVPAIYNAVYPDAWYEVLIFPGGRLAYEEASSLVTQMRDHTMQVVG